jgi:hypothetical protein
MSTVVRAVLCVYLCAAIVVASGCRKQSRDADAEKRTLESLGYLGAAPVSQHEMAREGVMLLEPERVAPGITVVCHFNSDSCDFVDMAGQVRHTLDLSPDKQDPRAVTVLEPYDQTDFIMMAGVHLHRIEWSGKIKWILRDDEVAFHHDVAVLEDGNVAVLYASERWIEHRGTKIPIFDNGIAIVHPDGSFEKRLSFYDTLAGDVSAERLDEIRAGMADKTLSKPKSGAWSTEAARFAGSGNATDVFHSNGLTIAPADTRLWKKGDFVVSFGTLGGHGGVYVLDRETAQVRWGYREVDWPHSPEALADGRILLFDNGHKRGYSRVIEIDPASKKVAREYKSHSPLFFSPTKGGAQLLPNGNYLVTESDSGHLFEVTREGEIVWDYWNLLQKDKQQERVPYRGVIYRAWRALPGDSTRVAALAQLANQYAGDGKAALQPIRVETPRVAMGKAWPEAAHGEAFLSFTFTEANGTIEYSGSATSLPAGDYQVAISREVECRGVPKQQRETLADFGGFRSNGQPMTLQGRVKGSAPQGGMAALLDHTVLIKDKESEVVACGVLFGTH